MPKECKRITHKEEAEASVKNGLLKKRFLNEEEAAIYLGMSARMLQNLRQSAPKKYTPEKIKELLRKHEMFSPPVTCMGEKKIAYDLKDLERYGDILPRVGQIPEISDDEWRKFNCGEDE